MHVKVDVDYTIQQETIKNLDEKILCIRDNIPFGWDTWPQSIMTGRLKPIDMHLKIFVDTFLV